MHKIIFEEVDRSNHKRLRKFNGFKFSFTDDAHKKKIDFVTSKKIKIISLTRFQLSTHVSYPLLFILLSPISPFRQQAAICRVSKPIILNYDMFSKQNTFNEGYTFTID